MSALSIHAQIKSIEAQLSVLKAQLRSESEPAQPRKSIGSLYGILSGQMHTFGVVYNAMGYREEMRRRRPRITSSAMIKR